MPACVECGKNVNLPYECNLCGYSFCSDHRLPENHSCEGLDSYKRGMREEGRMFREKEPTRREPSRTRRLSSFVSLKGNVAISLLAAIAIVYVLQLLVIALSPGLHDSLFVLGPDFVQEPWTVLTSMFSHAPTNPMHIFVNGLVLFFFGPTLERMIGSRRFVELYFVAGIAAGLGFVLATGSNVLGASGALFGVMGALTMLRPHMRVYVNFLIPMPLWILTLFYALFSVLMVGEATGVADLAHLIGLVIGLAWGYRVKGEVQMSRGGRGGGGLRFR